MINFYLNVPEIFNHLFFCDRFCFVYIPFVSGAQGVMVTIIGNGCGHLSSNIGKAVCISYSASSLGKGINSTILPPALHK